MWIICEYRQHIRGRWYTTQLDDWDLSGTYDPAEVPESRLDDLRWPDGFLLLGVFADTLLIGSWYFSRVLSQPVSTSATQNNVLSLPWEPSWNVYLSFSKYAQQLSFFFFFGFYYNVTLQRLKECDLKKQTTKVFHFFSSYYQLLTK